MAEKTKDEHLQEAGLAIGLWREMDHNLARQRVVLNECRTRHGIDALDCSEHAPIFTELADSFDEKNEVFEVVVGADA